MHSCHVEENLDGTLTMVVEWSLFLDDQEWDLCYLFGVQSVYQVIVERSVFDALLRLSVFSVVVVFG